jgi:hypothetical protein
MVKAEARRTRMRKPLLFAAHIPTISSQSGEKIVPFGSSNVQTARCRLTLTPQTTFMNNSFVGPDFQARCIDNAIWVGIGIFGLLYYPRRIRRRVKAGTLTETRGKTQLTRVWLISYFAIGFGVLRIFKVLP